MDAENGMGQISRIYGISRIQLVLVAKHKTFNALQKIQNYTRYFVNYPFKPFHFEGLSKCLLRVLECFEDNIWKTEDLLKFILALREKIFCIWKQQLSWFKFYLRQAWHFGKLANLYVVIKFNKISQNSVFEGNYSNKTLYL